MNREEIKEKLITLCAEIFKNSGVDRDLIEYVDFADDLGMDSITFITLIVGIEACFDIIIPDDFMLLDYFKNVDDVVQVIVDQLAEKTLETEKKSDDKT